MAGRRGSTTTALAGWRLALALCLTVCTFTISAAEPAKVYDIDLPAQNVADALTGLSEQTGVPVVFPYDLVRGQTANPVVGPHTLLEALDELLKNTGLSGGLSEKGVLTVSLAEARPPKVGETTVTRDDTQQKKDQAKAGKRAAIATFFASVAAAFSASAADDAVNAGSDQDKMASVVVTAQKREERQQDVPVAMTVLNPDQLAEDGQNRLVDYFSSVPGLDLASNSFFGGSQYVTIRGLSTTWDANPTVATVIDDVPVGGSQVLSFASITAPDLDPSDLARIEVLKGPQGTLYGSDSLGGLIKYVTADPSTSAFSGRAEVTGADIPDGGAGYAARVAINVPLSETFALRLSGFSRRDPGYIDNITTGQNNFNATDVYGGHLSVLYRPSENFSAKVSALIQNADSDGQSYVNSNGLGIYPQGDLKVTGTPGTSKWYTRWQFYAATLKAKVAGLDITSVTGYSRNTLANWEDYSGYAALGQLANSVVPGSTGYSQLNYSFTEKISEELRVSASVNRWFDWLVGGFYTHESSPGNSQHAYAANATTGALTGVIFTGTYSPLTLSEHAVFGDLTFHVTDRFDVQMGGRQAWETMLYESQYVGPGVPDFFQTTSDVFVVPTGRATGSPFTYLVTPKYTFSRDLQVYARVASGYRMGGPNIYSGPIFDVPSSYKADKTTNYELGVKGDLLEHRVSFDVAAYYIDWKDIQVNANTPIGGQYYTTNGGGAKSEGVELQITTHPLPGLTLGAQGSFNNAELTQDMPPLAIQYGTYGLAGDRLPYSTRVSGGFNANQDVKLTGDWTGFVGGTINYVGPRPYEFPSGPESPRYWMPGYTQINLHTGIRSQLWLVNLYLNNAADRRGVVGIASWPFNPGNTGGWYTSVIQPRAIGLNVSRMF